MGFWSGRGLLTTRHVEPETLLHLWKPERSGWLQQNAVAGLALLSRSFSGEDADDRAEVSLGFGRGGTQGWGGVGAAGHSLSWAVYLEIQVEGQQMTGLTSPVSSALPAAWGWCCPGSRRVSS